LLAPGWTDFHKRVQYQTYDVTPMLNQGANTIGVVLGGGWYSSPMTWSGFRFTPGPNLLRAQLDLTLANGQHKTIVTDPSWQTAAAPITFSEIYGGESYDARLVKRDWSSPHFNATGWTPAIAAVPPDAAMVISAQPDLPINTVLTIHPAVLTLRMLPIQQSSTWGRIWSATSAFTSAARAAPWCACAMPSGSTPTAASTPRTYATPTQPTRMHSPGEGDETWTPEFTFHGFRYVELSYLGAAPAAPPTLATIEGLVFNSLPPTPTVRLSSSSELLNKMNELGAWGQRGNFVSIPTDCPQRDERLGWMGDAGVFWRTGTYNFDIDAFTRKFMLDVTDAQTSAGAFTDVSPNLLGPNPGAPGWGDAGSLHPYAAWLQYGDASVVERSWPAMQRWMDFILANNPDYLRRNALGNNFGDWLAPDRAHFPRPDRHRLLGARRARDGRDGQGDPSSARCREVSTTIRSHRRCLSGSLCEGGRQRRGNTQTAYLATIFTGIAPPALVGNMVDRIAKDVEAHGNHLTTGFLGTPFLMFVLDQNGRSDLAFKLLLSDTYPSWGYMVKKGATTWWERWNGDTGDPSMNSYNHYAFGSVMAWVYRRAAGIDTDATGPGFHHLTIQPHFDPALPSSARRVRLCIRHHRLRLAAEPASLYRQHPGEHDSHRNSSTQQD
jgi:alpha-L-rhamnosidase